MDFKELLLLARISPRKAAQHLQLSPRTIYRYLKAGKAPRVVELALEFKAGTNPDWLGWRIQGPTIERPGLGQIHKHQIEQYEYMQYLQFMRGREFNTEEPAPLADNILFFRKQQQ